MSRGYFLIAQNSGELDYVRMAYALALSIKATQKTVNNISIGITPGYMMPDKYRQVFDHVIEIPWEDAARRYHWKLQNEWKSFHMTPYDKTMKIEADMLFVESVDHWWDLLDGEKFSACTDPVQYQGRTITSDYYRKSFTENNLPNVYSAMMYFEQHQTALDVFKMAEMIFKDWDSFSTKFLTNLHRPKSATTDIVFAMACELTGTDTGNFKPRFTHMKTRCQDWNSSFTHEQWPDYIPYSLTDDLEFKIFGYKQSLPVHYHVKNFLTNEIIQKYEKALDV